VGDEAEGIKIFVSCIECRVATLSDDEGLLSVGMRSRRDVKEMVVSNQEET
jgi:hypothetical protein